MSSSSLADTDAPMQGGKVVIGPRSVSLAELTLGSSHQLTWSMEAEEEYLVRVRGKAQSMAKDILARAMAEADRIRSQAREEGRRAGKAQAEAELTKAKKQVSEQCTGLLQAIQEQGGLVWRTHREDLVMLLQLMVEKVLAVELETNRREILVSLLDQAVDMVDAKRRIIISVHPRDRVLMEEILAHGGNGDTRLESWKVRENPQIEPGGLILECDHGMVDNTIASRKANLHVIVDQLTLQENG